MGESVGPMCIRTVLEKILTGSESVQQMIEKIKVSRGLLKFTQNRNKNWVNAKRKKAFRVSSRG